MNPLFIISSVIELGTSTKGDGRSRFDSEERYSQTIRTIESIKKHCDNAGILLCEGGISSKFKFDNVDHYYYLGDDKSVRESVDSQYKGLGEARMLEFIAQSIPAGYDYIFKISGRYELSDDFNVINYDKNHFNFFVYERSKWIKRKGLHRWNEIIKGSYSTRLYGFPKELVSIWAEGLLNSEKDLVNGLSIEQALPRALRKEKIFFLKCAGVTGTIAGTGEIIKE